MRRFIYVGAAVVVFVVGIVSRVIETDSVLLGKYLGDALYAVMFYLCLAIAWPHHKVQGRTLATIAFVVCIECFQLTGIPLSMRHSDNVLARLVSVVLGTKFGWYDVVSYLFGIAGGVFLEEALTRLFSGRSLDEHNHV